MQHTFYFCASFTAKQFSIKTNNGHNRNSNKSAEKRFNNNNKSHLILYPFGGFFFLDQIYREKNAKAPAMTITTNNKIKSEAFL